MERTPLPPAAEALFRAHHDRSTGWLTLVCGGREAKLYLQHGDLVGARLGFGHQTAAQALLAAGELVPPALDLLWSRASWATRRDSARRRASTPPRSPTIAPWPRFAGWRSSRRKRASCPPWWR